MKFIVDRRTWCRGQGSSGSALLKDNGQRCCIGFVGQQCEIPDASLRMVRSVHSQNADQFQKDKWPKWMYGDGFDTPSILSRAYSINDTRLLTDAAREADLKTLFAEQGDEIEFVN